MATDYLLEIEGIKGESKDTGKTGTIDVLSFSWGCSNSGSHGMGGGGGAGKVNMQDITFSAMTSKASPTLMQRCCDGKHIPKAVLHVSKQSGEQAEYYTIEITDLIVSSFSASGSSGSDAPMESFSFNFAQLKFDFKPQKTDGTLDAPIKSGWNVETNTKA